MPAVLWYLIDGQSFGLHTLHNFVFGEYVPRLPVDWFAIRQGTIKTICRRRLLPHIYNYPRRMQLALEEPSAAAVLLQCKEDVRLYAKLQDGPVAGINAKATQCKDKCSIVSSASATTSSSYIYKRNREAAIVDASRYTKYVL